MSVSKCENNVLLLVTTKPAVNRKYSTTCTYTASNFNIALDMLFSGCDDEDLDDIKSIEFFTKHVVHGDDSRAFARLTALNLDHWVK